MTHLIVNGQSVSVTENKRLLTFLREDLNLVSVKNGCSEGACGTCMVLIDGKPTKACIPRVTNLAGKHILTVEGLSIREKEVYSYAFLASGAVQCGFCIPGMVISAKGLLDQTPDPNPVDVKRAIKNNICRCTGYKKIEQAILLAAQLLRDNLPIPTLSFSGKVGESLHRVDALHKILGLAEYVDDIRLEGMLYGGAVRSAYPRAVVNHIDISEAL
ncbi:MAG: 2Fe-2S iron-sulfur cluster-binding protein, partial [Cellulosilyticaceae bacterium]